MYMYRPNEVMSIINFLNTQNRVGPTLKFELLKYSIRHVV